MQWKDPPPVRTAFDGDSTISVAGLQTSYGEDTDANIRKTVDLVREAAS